MSKEQEMGRKKKVEPDDKEQSTRFIETAESIKNENDNKNFDNAIDLILHKEVPANSKYYEE
jgi:hypothetical protein